MPEFKMPEMPKMPEVAPPPPPQERDMGAYNEGANAEMQRAQRREGYQRSILRGESGGYNAATGSSLLG
jgi:hypothetical protein